jgi:formylglycine-generating enzyme required for sulfatase activity
MEQEIRFRTEEAKLRQEKADLEKKLEEERSTLERIQAIKKSQNETQPVPAKHRSKLIGVFGIAILSIFAVGFAITKLWPGLGAAGVPTLAPAEGLSTSTAVPVIPVTSKDSPTPAPEVPLASEVPATQRPTEVTTITASAPLSEIADDMGVEMALVSEGDFTMGSNRGEADEQPSHTVYLDSFYIDKFEVTNKLYKACVDAGLCEPPRHTYFFSESPNKAYYGNPEYDNYPVIYVDWVMAKTYCEWRGARLPTEAEWEKAARGTEGNIYSWGKELDCQKANYQKCVNRTSEVGSYEDGVSPYGAYDMTGNVWEWVADWYSDNYYSMSARKNPTGPITGQSRVMRGGSWPRFDVTTYHRNKFAPTYNTFDIGFRCARDVSP